jgi:predicted dehydrogenase
MEKVRVAVIGAGWWGTAAHIPALKIHPQAELVAVQSRSPEKARKIAADFNVPHACTTAEEVLAIDGLDAVIVSSTPNMHYAHAKAALERGLHVLIEKPMTFTVAESQELVDLASRKGLQFAVSCPWHYTPHGIEARRLIQSGALGQLKMISMLMTNFTEGLYQGLTWDKVFGKNPTLQNDATPYRTPGLNSYSDPAVAGGGQIYCQVSHVAGYLGFLTDVDPAEVFARFDNGDSNVDVFDSLNIKLRDGTLVSMASHGAPMYSDRQHEVRVYGTRGMILLELWKGKFEFHDFDCKITRYPDIPEADIYPMYEPATNLVDAIVGKAPNGSPATLGLYAMKIIEAATQSAHTGANVVIKPT